MPVLVWGGSHIWAGGQEMWWHIKKWRQKANPLLPGLGYTIDGVVKAIATDTRIRTPLVRVELSARIGAYTVISPVPGLPRVIVLSRGAAEQLPERCLRALLAHEVGHIYLGHTRSYTLLRLISRVLMLGPSFFTGSIRTPDRLEAEADAFAVRWLESHGGSRADLVEALERAERQRIEHLLAGGLGGSMVLAGGVDWLPPRLRRVLEAQPAKSCLCRLVHGWRLLHFMALHSDLATYMHLPYSKRLRLIAELPLPPHK